MGMGRSYGDSALGPRIISSRYLNLLAKFDPAIGTLRCGAGVTLAEILEVFVPKGWFLPVTPGTKFVTLGGAIASDVHGKNHHLDGCFSEFVEGLKLLLASGEVVDCSRSLRPDLFRATCGGMGLTGLVTEAEIKLKPIRGSLIEQTTLKAANLDEALSLFDAHHARPYSVAWIDCLSLGRAMGRSLVILGEHSEYGVLASVNKRPLSVPFDLPSWLLNHGSVKAFNALYYHRIRAKRSTQLVHYERFFYPLDGIRNWNRLYGKRGFTQYQCVIPQAAGKEGVRAVLKRIASSGTASFLAVLKALGDSNANYLSFPMKGYTLALDLKLEEGILELLQDLDSLVLDYGGRLYLTKDCRMNEATFKRGYSQWETFQDVRQKYGALGKFKSLQSERIGLH